MQITFGIDRSSTEGIIYINDREIEYAIYSGESIDVNSQFVTLYTKPCGQLTVLSRILLFIKRFITNIFNIIIMNFPNKWYENAKPFVFKPIIIDTRKEPTNNIEIKVEYSKIDLTAHTIKKPQIYVNNEVVSSEIVYDEEGINRPFLTYIYDMISLLLYACALISVVFLCSGKLGLPMVVIYSIIMLTTCIPVLYKCICTYKEKNSLIKMCREMKFYH